MVNWVVEWHRIKAMSENEEHNIINPNFSINLSKNELDSQRNLHNQDKNIKNTNSAMKAYMKNNFSKNIVMLHSSPLFIIENAVQLLEIPPDKIIATFSNFSLTSNTLLPELPVYLPPIPEDILYYDPLEEMKIIPLSKYTQSRIKISHSDKFFKKRKREMSPIPIDVDDIPDKQRIIINDFSLANSQTSNLRKKSSYPSQLRPPNMPLNSENRKPIWTSDEDDLLMTYLPKYQFNWEFVAQTLTPSIKWVSPLEKKNCMGLF
ncbi:unnamed protein product [Pneumocystis jirovecii]|uniref:Uncharacterized protein n=1 Tax=Pneumocystis jirovecii TaxID=42068 RepID=L0PC87_PNEJI|nr:unnamed protein product [Pneumocystis jirovecii]